MTLAGALLLVAAIDDTHEGVRSLRLVARDGSTLAPYAPGSHVFVECAGRRNAYSLTGTGTDDYEISVRRDAEGHGGSVWIHDGLAVGDELWVSRPRCTFAPVASARRGLYVAAGIGVTPLLSHVRAAIGTQFEFVYVTHGPTAVHLDELTELCGPRLTHVVGRDRARAALTTRLKTQPIGTYLYACGPAPMLDELTALARDLGWPPSRVQLERFDTADAQAGDPFEVRLASTGQHLTVAAGQSLLDALLAHGVEVDNLCRQGVCGECRTPVRSGALIHRDHVLSDGERAAGRDVLCCVSRATGLLELDV